MVDKHDLRGSIEKMREVAQLLALWAADMERSLGVPGNHPRISLPRSRRPASGPAPEQATVKIPEPAAEDVSSDLASDPVPAVTFDQVRSILAAKCAAGYRTQVQALINSFGASRFSEVDPSHYAELMVAAGLLGGDPDAG